MQAARRRVGLAVRQEGRRRLRDRNNFRHKYERDRREELVSLKGRANQHIKTTRKNRKEDYDLGPLAPRRDIGKDAETYGTVDSIRFQRVTVPKWKRRWCGFEVGDRVVLLKGRDKGKIGVVDEKDEESETVRVKDLNMAEMYLPEWLRKTQGHDMPTGAYSMPIAWDDVRLVYALEDPEDDYKLKDMIIETLERKEVYTDPDTLETEVVRVCPDRDGEVIPWIEKQESEKKDHDGDTLRIIVEQRTWLPTLNEPPFPESVIDELRNRYSKYRVPDNDSFVRLRQQHEENKKTRNIEWMKAMRTPLQELHALQAHRRREELREKGLEAPMPEVELKRGKKWNWKAGRKEDEPIDEEFLERIGSMLAEKKAAGTPKARKKPQRVIA